MFVLIAGLSQRGARFGFGGHARRPSDHEDPDSRETSRAAPAARRARGRGRAPHKTRRLPSGMSHRVLGGLPTLGAATLRRAQGMSHRVLGRRHCRMSYKVLDSPQTHAPKKLEKSGQKSHKLKALFKVTPKQFKTYGPCGFRSTAVQPGVISWLDIHESLSEAGAVEVLVF